MISYDMPDKKTALQAKYDAQKIAFGPIVFQASMALRDLGILEQIQKVGDTGISAQSIADKLKLTLYGVNVLLEVGLSSDIVYMNGDHYVLGKTGYFLLKDEMTRVNMNFVNDICYKGMFELQDAIKEQRPAGLKELGEADTIYELLSSLPEKTLKSWLEFDHYYSDISFPEILPLVFANAPKSIFDVGGNTGKFSIKCASYNPDVEMTIVDLPGQLEIARKNIDQAGFSDRIHLHHENLLSDEAELPGKADVIWMSQFLDCFSEDQIVSILKRAKNAMHENSSLFIMELFWDRQRFEAAAFSLHNTSLYFTCLANGNSKIYHSREFIDCVKRAGLRIVDQRDNVGISHTLLECKL